MTANERPQAGQGAAEPIRTSPMAMCPMAETCGRMAEKPFPRFLMPLPGLMLIIVGVLILVVPALLVWFVGIGLIAMGLMMVVMASFMTRMGTRFRHMHQ